MEKDKEEVVMTMEAKISIIIPVYKVEKYLPKCLDSVIRQTYRNLEIILVDDGSPDGCGAVCDRYAGKDHRIHVIHKGNEGVACARNVGIRHASGDYISFIDSDDWIAEDAYEKLYQGLLQYGADCAVGRCIKVIEKNGRLTPQKAPAAPLRRETSAEAMRNVLLKGSAIWNRLFKREVFQDIRFPTGRVNDDEVTALHAYAKCDKIVFIDQDTYYYRIRQGSITTSRFSVRNVDCYYNSRDNLQFIRQERPELTECAEYKVIKAMLYSYVNLWKLGKNKETEKIQKEIHRDIRSHISVAWTNQYVPLYLKILILICAV